MASSNANGKHGLTTPIDDTFTVWSSSDDTRTAVIDEYRSNPPHDNNAAHKSNHYPPSMQQDPSSTRLDNIVSSLFDIKKHINNKAKVSEFERLIDLLLLKFNDMQSEKFNLLQQIHNLEKENDALHAQKNAENKGNDSSVSSDDEFKNVEFTGLETEKSVILVDYCNIMAKKKKQSKKSSIAPWTKYYNRHKTGIGEDLRIAIISSEKLQNVKSYTNDECFVERLQNIEMRCYFPKVFKALRDIYHVSLQAFISSFKVNHLLEVNQCQSSLSGSQFFYSFDGKYIIKSMRREEVTFIKQMIHKYQEYIESNKNKSHINQLFAMFKIVNDTNHTINKVTVNIPQYFIIMKCIYYDDKHNNINIVDDTLTIYDLKGSKYNRITEKQHHYEFCFSKENEKRVSILKDHEWMEQCPQIDILYEEQQRIKDQLFKDIQFLKSMEIMDYSLLVALYDKEKDIKERNGKYKKYFIGIIDFLQHFTFWKQVEGNGAYYILGIDGYDIVDPEQYANRLWKFVCDFVFPSYQLKVKRL